LVPFHSRSTFLFIISILLRKAILTKYPVGVALGTPSGYIPIMQTVAEMPTFTKQAEKLLSADERKDVIDFLSQNPLSGDVIQGTGGVRKVRIAASGRGKRGGARVIYYFLDESIPLYALAIYAKNAKTDLTHDEKNAAKLLVEELKKLSKG